MKRSKKSDERRGRQRHDAVLSRHEQEPKKKIQEKCGEIDGPADLRFFSESRVANASDPDTAMLFFRWVGLGRIVISVTSCEDRDFVTAFL